MLDEKEKLLGYCMLIFKYLLEDYQNYRKDNQEIDMTN